MLVISLLLTVALPHLRGVLRYVSPLLFFVVLSLLAIGVIIFATYDDAPQAHAVAAPAAVANATVAAAPAQTERFIFENTERDVSAAADYPGVARPIAFAVVLMLSLLVILRAIVSQADKQSLAPLVYVVVAALVLLCIYVLTNPASHASLQHRCTPSGRP